MAEKKHEAKIKTLYDYYRYHADKREEGLLPVPEYQNPTLFWADLFHFYDRNGAPIEDISGPDMTTEQFEKYKNYIEFRGQSVTGDYTHHGWYKEPTGRPVMHVMIKWKSYIDTDQLQKLSEVMRKLFSSSYDIVFTPDAVMIDCDKTVRVEFNGDTDIGAMVERLRKYAEEATKDDKS